MTGIILALLVLLGLSCGNGQSVWSSSSVEEDQQGIIRETTIMESSVNSEMVDCVGVGPRKCLVVDGNFFYDSIDVFDFEPGYHYVIRMERYDAWPDREEPPQDASRYGYRLIEILDKVQEP
jgi:hypothetical protein